MSVASDAIRVIVALSSVSTEYIGSTDTGASREYLGAILASSFGDYGAMAGAIPSLVPKSRILAKKRIEAMYTDYDVDIEDEIQTSEWRRRGVTNKIRWALTVVELLEHTAGFKPPINGGDFEVGSDHLTTACEHLVSALPDHRWHGDASQNYLSQNEALRNHAQTWAGLSLELAAITRDQAEWNTHMRLGLGGVKDLLVVALIIEAAIFFGVRPPSGLIASDIFATTVCTLGISAALSMLTALKVRSDMNARLACQLDDQYREISERLASTVSQSRPQS